MSKILVVVDMQKDYIDGALGTAEAEKIVDGVIKRIDDFDGEVVFTMDTHSAIYLQTQEGKNLPVPHCIKGTDGWKLDSRIEPLSKYRKIFEKPTFGSIALTNYIADGNYKEIELHRHMRNFKRAFAQSVSAGRENFRKCGMLCGRDAAKPRKCAFRHENVPD